MTKDNHSKKQPAKEEGPTREDRIKYAKINLGDSYLTDLATSQFARKEDYGGLVEGMYESAVYQTPGENAYQQLFLPELMNEGGSINQARLKQKAAQIIQSSFASLPVFEALTQMGANANIDKKYLGKHVDELDQKEIQMIMGTYMQYLVEKTITEKMLPQRQEGRVKGLESIFGAKPEEKPKQN